MNTEQWQGGIPSEEKDKLFIQYKEEFDKIESYTDRLSFWNSKRLEGLTYQRRFDGGWDQLFGNPFIKESADIKISFFSIRPRSGEETKTFVESLIQKVESEKGLTIDVYYETFVGNYWRRLSKTTCTAKNFLVQEIDKINKAIEPHRANNNEEYGPLTSQMFNHSFDRLESGDEIPDYDQVYHLTYGGERKTDKKSVQKLNSSPELVFIELLKGSAYARYKGFLDAQYERLEKGENIQYEDAPYTPKYTSMARPLVMLTWNANKSALADLFIQLIRTSHPKTKKILLENGMPDIAAFLKTNFYCYANTDLETIETTLEKISSGKRPKETNRIDIHVTSDH